jgi:hypothetical protein
MTKKMMISLLQQGNTGDEILQILETLTSEESQENQPTLDEIQF